MLAAKNEKPYVIEEPIDYGDDDPEIDLALIEDDADHPCHLQEEAAQLMEDGDTGKLRSVLDVIEISLADATSSLSDHFGQTNSRETLMLMDLHADITAYLRNAGVKRPHVAIREEDLDAPMMA